MSGLSKQIMAAIKEQLGAPLIVAKYNDAGVTFAVSLSVHTNQLRVYDVAGIDTDTAQCLIEECEAIAMEENLSVVWRVDDRAVQQVLRDNRYTLFPSTVIAWCKSHINILRDHKKVPA